MEQNSIDPTSHDGVAVETPPTEAPRRRASRRVTAAAGEAVVVPEIAGAPEVVAPAQTAPAPLEAAVSDASTAPEAAEPKKRVSRARKKTDTVPAEAAAEHAPQAEASQQELAEVQADTAVTEAAPKKAPARRKRPTAAEKAAAEADAAAVEAEAPAASTESAEAAPGADHPDGASAQGETAEQEDPAPKRRNTRSRGKKPAAEAAEGAEGASNTAAAAGAAKTGEAEQPAEQNDEKQTEGASNGRGGNGNGAADSQTRSNRTRQRERKRRGQNDGDEPEIAEDDVLLPIAGILDVLDNYAFVRTSGYLPGTGDVYVSLGQVKKYGLRKGDAVVGAIRQPREGDGGGRQKYNAIVKVDSINSKPVDEQQSRPEFADFTPVNPDERLRLETDSAELGSRVVDLFAPVGKGQRGLIVGPHESGKSSALQQIARAVAQNQPDAHLMLVLLDERPEEATALTRTINGEVIASTFDRPAEDHVTIAELAVERAKRLVELGHDVVVLIDSLTSLARAYNLAAPAATRVPAGSLDAAAVFPVKRLLSAARNIENGGSLTIIATVSAQAGSQFDDALIGELEGTANMQLRLSGEAADRRIFPAIDLRRSSTRNEALLTSEAEARVLNRLRRAQHGENQIDALLSLLDQLESTSSNVEFLAVTQRAQA